MILFFFVWHITDTYADVLMISLIWDFRSNYKTPLKGLYLCGSGAHPGGGVMGAPGRNAARLVLEDVRKT